MRHAGWLAAVIVALLLQGCQSAPQETSVLQPRRLESVSPVLAGDHSASHAARADYLVRPDTGERQILRQLVHELQLARHLIDDAYTRRDEHARVRIDYARLADEFDRIVSGLRRTLTVTETAPRARMDITGEYQSYE